MGPGRPYRIVTRRLHLRCYEADDAPLVKEAVDSSLEHLRVFMDWAWAAPEPLETVEERLLLFRDQFERGEELIFGLFAPDGSTLLGGSGLHRRVGPGALEVGYWIRSSHVRQGLATEAAAALTQFGFERLGLERLEIHVDPANTASLGVPAKLRYVYEATLRKRLPPIPPSVERRDVAIFSLLSSEYEGSPGSELELEVLDASGRAA